MVPDRVPATAVALLAVSALLLANPLYLQDDDPGSQTVHVEETTLARGVAQLTAHVEEVDDLPVVARYAARRYLSNGSFPVARDGPPLALQVLGQDGHYLASIRREQVFDPSVSTGPNGTVLELDEVPVAAVEERVGQPPPAGLEENQTARRIAVLADDSEAVVLAGQFRGDWEMRLEGAVTGGGVTVPNGNDASTLGPLGDEVGFVVVEGAALRANVTETGERVRLDLRPVTNETLLSATDVEVVRVASLPPGARDVVRTALTSENGYTRFSAEEVEEGALSRERSMLLRDAGTYYVLHRGHVDDISFLPVVRAALALLGVLVGLAGLAVLYRQWE